MAERDPSAALGGAANGPGLADALGELSEDRLLGGRLSLVQPRRGHRAGSDAALLAAALPDLGRGPLIDLGSGVGTVGLSAALIQPELEVVLVERDPDLAALAARNVVANRLEGRVRAVGADVAAIGLAGDPHGLAPASVGCVALNPPFYVRAGTKVSPVANRRAAHVVDTPLPVWIAAARRLLRPGGTVAAIHRAEALPDILALLGRGFGGIAIRPVHGMAGRPAIRVIVSAIAGSRAPVVLLPGLVLNRPDGRLTAESDALHRGASRLASPHQ
jgi:tRNA1(Val) A37 N6-methylase TrmN6